MKIVIIDDDKEIGVFTLTKENAKAILSGEDMRFSFGGYDGVFFPSGILEREIEIDNHPGEGDRLI